MAYWPLKAFMPDDDLLASNLDSARRQEYFFSLLNLILIGALLILQAVSRAVRGRPSASVVEVLTAGFLIQAAQLTWLKWTVKSSSATQQQRTFTFWFIGFNSALSLVLTSLTMRGDTAYYALMLLPLLQAAFRLSLGATLGVVALADFICFQGAYGMRFGEYIEAGAMTVIYTVMAILVWLLVNNLREREARFVTNLKELERTRQRLLSEEKLAAVGRLSRAIAHEIRNPVAMISSSLATATRAGQQEEVRQEMFAIAAKEASRLERLTTDFLVYARPAAPRVSRANVADVVNYVATVARAHAMNKGVNIEVVADSRLQGDFDAAQIQQALLNLVLNAVDACRQGETVSLKVAQSESDAMRIDVIDPAGPIDQESVSRIFEPLFTTKQEGNGLGLAIARNIARANGGDLVLRINNPGQVCFSLEIPHFRPPINEPSRAEQTWAKSWL
ncbi:MAG TPA: ATP-binding protein [Candidatus Binataceae bacterium]|nr:ATP-binding protein [Candidatus Binataceae bacterium]